MKRWLVLIAFLCITLPACEAWGYANVWEYQLGDSLGRYGSKPLVVTGRFLEAVILPAANGNFVVFRQKEWPFKIDSVVLGDQSYKGETVNLVERNLSRSALVFSNDELVPFEKGNQCALLLWVTNNNEPKTFTRYKTLPVSTTDLPMAADDQQAGDVLVDEILKVLEGEKLPSKQLQLILLAAPALSVEETQVFVPYLSSPDQWVRRAALYALACKSQTPEYMLMAKAEIERMAKDAPNDDAFSWSEEGEARSRLYFAINVRFKQVDREVALANKPLIILISKLNTARTKKEWVWHDYGAKMLRMVATWEDASLLYDLCGKEDDRQRLRTMADYRAGERSNYIDAFSSIFMMNLPFLPDMSKASIQSDKDGQKRQAFIKQHQEHHQMITQRLLKEGLITVDQVHQHDLSFLTDVNVHE